MIWCPILDAAEVAAGAAIAVSTRGADVPAWAPEAADAQTTGSAEAWAEPAARSQDDGR